jgi:hypothetical protein
MSPVVLKIEPDAEVREFMCIQCGRPFRRVLGYVMNGPTPHAVYHADLYVDHPHAQASAVLTISIGNWSESADPSSRRRARLAAHPDGKQIVMQFLDFPEDQMLEPQLGVLLTADDARRNSDRRAFEGVADAVVYQDARVRNTLDVSDRRA